MSLDCIYCAIYRQAGRKLAVGGESGDTGGSRCDGATPFQVIRYFLLPEAFSSLILSLTTASIGLIGATAMAGAVGGGGIGDLAIAYGYQRFDTLVMLITVIILVLFVQGVQSLGNLLSRKARRG